jgi:hypothetical protein
MSEKRCYNKDYIDKKISQNPDVHFLLFTTNKDVKISLMSDLAGKYENVFITDNIDRIVGSEFGAAIRLYDLGAHCFCYDAENDEKIVSRLRQAPHSYQKAYYVN